MQLLSSTDKMQAVDHYVERLRHLCEDDWLTSCLNDFGVDPGKLWGTKVDVRDVPVVERYCSIHDISLDSVHWIWLQRRDKIAQAISHCRGIRHGTWQLRASDSESHKAIVRADIDIPIDEINWHVMFYFFVDMAWADFFSSKGLDPYVLFYEDFFPEPKWESTITGILDFLGVAYDLPLPLSCKYEKASYDAPSSNYDKFVDYNHDLFKEYNYPREFWSFLYE